MNFKLNALVAAALMAASAPTFAVMADATSGNGELLVNLRFYNGNNDSGGNDISGVFDLGMTMDDFRAAAAAPGYTRSWDLAAANYGTAWNDIQTFAASNTYLDNFGNVMGVNAIEFNVIALDNTNTNTSGGARYLTTGPATFPALPNQNLNSFQFMNGYVTKNNVRGTHVTEANGASTATSSDQDIYFGKVNGGFGDGDNWAGQTNAADTTKTLATSQYFWFLTTSSVQTTAQAIKTPFGFDIDGNGTLSLAERGLWSFNGSVITYANPVPEAETYAMMLAGLGLVGFMARRRMQRAA